MAGERVERRLAAILAADVVGYSRLMSRDETGTLDRLRTLRRDVIDPEIAAHRGRLFKLMGDGLLAEFGSAVQAVSCAIAIQRAVEQAAAADDDASKLRLRIGIHLGDVIVEHDDLLGDGVNIAARLEAIAAVGGIAISRAVHDQVRDRLDAPFHDRGEIALKNIARPVQVFGLAFGLDADPAGFTDAAASALSDKPSIAVLPFQNMTADPEQEFFADGIAEDIITALSRYPSLLVIARNSSFTYKGRAVAIQQIGRELGVRYVLEGSLRKAGHRVRLSAQLIEAATGAHVWAGRYDRDLADIFAVQDEITEATTSAIAPAIASAEQQRAMRKAPTSLDAWGAYQRGLWHLGKATDADNQSARQFFESAVARDPMFAGGYIGLSAVLSRAKGTQAEEEAMARRAVALDGNDADARARLSLALLAGGDHAGACAEAERALALCPNLAAAHGARGVALAYAGRPREAIAALESCLRLDPCGPSLVNRLNQLALAHYFCGDYAACVAAADRAISAFPDFPSPYRWRAAALGQLGRTEDARHALARAIAVSPSAFAFQVQDRPPWFRPDDHAHMIAGLRQAGWDG